MDDLIKAIELWAPCHKRYFETFGTHALEGWFQGEILMLARKCYPECKPQIEPKVVPGVGKGLWFDLKIAALGKDHLIEIKVFPEKANSKSKIEKAVERLCNVGDGQEKWLFAFYYPSTERDNAGGTQWYYNKSIPEAGLLLRVLHNP